MYNPFKRTKITQTPMTQHSFTPPPMPTLQQHRLSPEDELSVMIAALTNVVSGSSSATATVPADQKFYGYPWQPSPPPPPTFDGAAAASASSPTSTGTDCTDTFLPPSSELDTCHVCNINGCLGCNFFPPPPTQENTTDNHRQHQQGKKIVVSSGSASGSSKKQTQQKQQRVKKNFRGVRQRPWGKWAAEIRDPRKAIPVVDAQESETPVRQTHLSEVVNAPEKAETEKKIEIAPTEAPDVANGTEKAIEPAPAVASQTNGTSEEKKIEASDDVASAYEEAKTLKPIEAAVGTESQKDVTSEENKTEAKESTEVKANV